MTTNNNDLVYSPQQVSSLTAQQVQQWRNDPFGGVSLGIPSMDKDINRLRQDLVTVVGRPGNGKTTFMMSVANHVVDGIIDKGRYDDYVAYCSWEVSAEESGVIGASSQTLINIADIVQGRLSDKQWDAVMGASVERAARPLWVIGHSGQDYDKIPSMTLQDVSGALVWIRKELGKRPRLIVLDYLQLVDMPEGVRPGERHLEVAWNARMAKGLVRQFGCPVIMGSQARREVDSREFKVPGLSDAAESGVVEHASDKIIGVWMPKVTEGLGAEIGNPPMIVTEDLMVVSVPKQRYGKSGMTYFLSVNPAICQVRDAKVASVNTEWAT